MKYIGEREPHYGLRKLSVGVASVLLGISIYGVVGYADSEVPVNSSKNVNVNENAGDVNNGASDQIMLQNETGGDNPAGAQNAEGEGTRDQENVAVNGQQSVKENTLNTSGVQNGVLSVSSVNSHYGDQKVVTGSSVQLSSQGQNDQVENVHFQFIDRNSGKPTYESTVKAGSEYAVGLDGSFSVDSSAFSKGAPALKLGTFSFSHTPDVNSDKYIWSQFQINGAQISYDGSQVGYLKLVPAGGSKTDLFCVPMTKINKIGKVMISFHILDAIMLDHNSPAINIEGIGFPQTHYLRIGDASFALHLTEPKYRPSDYSKDLDGNWTWDTTSSAYRLLSSARLQYIPSNIVSQLVASKGQSSNDFNRDFQYGAHIVTKAGLTGLRAGYGGQALPINPQTGQIMVSDSSEPMLYWYFINPTYEQTNLSLAQLKALNQAGMLVSRQDDGSYNAWINLSPNMLKGTDTDWDNFAKGTYYNVINGVNPTEVQNAIKNFYQKGKLESLPLTVTNEIDLMLADQTVKSTATVDYYLRDLSHIGTSHVTSTPVKNSIKGQSTVKLHVVSSTNGTDLATVKSFTDWPNQGKHAHLDIPTIAGYQLAENPQSVLTKFHLNEKTITANSVVDYPAENTIADYYIVMEPKDESMSVNIVDDDENGKVLDSGTISGKFSDRVVETSDIQGKVKKLLDSGLYTLESNDLDNGLTFKDGTQTATVKLKHKLDSVQRHYRVIEDLPDGTKKVIIDMEATLYKDAARSDWQDYGAYTVDGKLLKTNEVKLLKQTNILDNPGSAMDWVNANIDSVLGYRHYIDRKTYPHYGYYYGGLGIWGDDSTIWMDLFRRADSHDGFGFATSVFPSTDFHILYTPKDEVATVNIVDTDENNKVLSTGTVSGKFNSQIVTNDDIQAKLKALMDTGHYVLVSNGFDNAVKYQDGNNIVTITLKHKLDSIQRHYRVIEDLPDGNQKVIIDINAVLYKDANSNLWYQLGAYADDNLKNKILESNEYHVWSGYVRNKGENSFLIAYPDQVQGYHRIMIGNTGHVYDQGLRCSLESDNSIFFDLFNNYDNAVQTVLPSTDFHIKYIKNQYPVTIAYYDQTGKQIASSTKAYDYLTQVNLSATAPANYVLLSGQPGQLIVGTDTNEVDLLVAPKIERSQENKVITRTINLHGGNVKIGPVIQKVVFVREKVLNLATGDTSYGNWQVQGDDQFSMYVPPIIDGYHINKVDAKIVSADDSDSTVDLNYEQNESEQRPMYIDVNGKSYDKLPDGYHVVKGQNSRKGSLLIVKDEAAVVTPKIEYATRTITVYMPNGRTRTIKQRTRKGGKFLAAHLPKLHGYKLIISGNIDSMTANGDVTASVKFVKM